MSTPDQLAVASLMGHAERCVAQRFPLADAVAGLKAITTRSDLLAEAAGVMVGAADPEVGNRPGRIRAARLLVAAGADREQLPKWIAQGRRNVIQPPRPGWGIPYVWPDDLDELLAAVLDDTGADVA